MEKNLNKKIMEELKEYYIGANQDDLLLKYNLILVNRYADYVMDYAINNIRYRFKFSKQLEVEKIMEVGLMELSNYTSTVNIETLPKVATEIETDEGNEKLTEILNRAGKYCTLDNMNGENTKLTLIDAELYDYRHYGLDKEDIPVYKALADYQNLGLYFTCLVTWNDTKSLSICILDDDYSIFDIIKIR